MRHRAALPAVTALTALALALTAAPAAHAHGDTLKVEVTGQVQGHVTTDVTWENDNDPVDENVAATVNAVSPDGDRTVGPWKLQRDPAKAGRYTTAETLPAGQWKVTVEVGFPALGRGEKELTVDPAAEPRPFRPHRRRPRARARLRERAPAERGTGAAGWGTKGARARPRVDGEFFSPRPRAGKPTSTVTFHWPAGRVSAVV
ncbi:hypothetical protein BLA24_04275 [Streptomyces cinnamoneus]|uniref:DUF4198 domain-containing protein n=1 Tax=Streptomyces cinnamoneus TaxID=53446 RepID=A0A2G1XP69_STRCJ|nr:hypothetical protein [Streptomyces cinnamoneus]PHQ53010.1 hypothetical protein BLA24_04275 [Streptomyces cinnamoneus]